MKSYKISFLFIFFFVGIFFACEETTTDNISSITYYPDFEIIGGEFYTVVQGQDFTDPGVVATEDGKELEVTVAGDQVDTSTPDVYTITYTATNSDGFSKTVSRTVVVTLLDVSQTETDLSGTYTGGFSGTAENSVKKVNENGLYSASEVFGYPGYTTSGQFVDIGNGNLILLLGDSAFGRYDKWTGSYDASTLNWVISLIDPPNVGVQIPVSWSK